MKKVLMYIVDVLLWLLAWMLLPLFTIANYFFTKPKFRYSYKNALALDIFGNVCFAPMLNKLLITESGYKFGKENEYISGVLGHNILLGTLTPIGKLLVKILTEKHCLDAINITS